MKKYYYIKYAISPVQEFIEASMSTKDMWASSYMISYIAARVMYALGDAAFVYPKFKESKFKKLLDSKNFTQENTMPNLPNTFLAKVEIEEGKIEDFVKSLNDDLAQALQDISIAVKEYFKEKYPKNELNDKLFDAQAKAMFSSQYFVFEATTDKEKDIKETEKYFAYYKNTRAFKAWNNASSWSHSELGSDSLNGKEEAVVDFAGEIMGASTLCKRFFLEAYIVPKYNAGNILNYLNNVLATLEGKYDKKSENAKEKYYAMLMLDGDNMGKLLSSDIKLEEIPAGMTQRDFVSNNLTIFSGEKVEAVVNKHKGVLIYSGGDDVFALLPIKNAIECIREIRKTFKALFNDDKNVDVSCGLSIAHKKAYLSHIVRSAHKSEKRAKNDVGRQAVAIYLIKSSGEIVEADFKLDSPVLALYKYLLGEITDGKLANGFANKLLNVLSNYVPMSKDYEYNIEDFFNHSNDILKLEFAIALDRDDFLAKLEKTDKEASSKLKMKNKFNEIFIDKEPKDLWEEFASMLQLLAWMDGR